MISKSTLDKMKAIWEYARKRKPVPVPSMVILTGVDSVCEHVERETSKVFHSKLIHEVVQNVSQASGYPELKISPQRNYVSQQEKVPDIDALTLWNTKQIFDMAADFCDEICDDMEEKEEE